ncbi:MAG: DUF1659 domain-containing protein [Proteocatella sp.]
MADTAKNETSLKLVYVLEINGDDEVTKSRTIAGINPDASDEQVLELANAILKLQNKQAHISRVDAQVLGA